MKTLAFFFALILPAFARLGENVQQCTARYGAPTLESKDGTWNWYKKNGIEIRIDFRSSTAVSISFSHASSGFTDLFTKLTDEQVQAILDANAVGGPWKPKEWPKGRELDGITGKLLARGDDKAQARWDYAGGSITLTTLEEIETRAKEEKALLERQNEAKKQEAIRSTQGF